MGLTLLVTGGAGYIGSILCRKLLERTDYRVRLYDTFMYGIEPVLPLVGHPRFDIIEGDIRTDKVKEALAGADVVIHLAAIVGYPACSANPPNAISTNVDGTKNLLKYLGKDQLFIYASTGSVYGKVEGMCSEDTPLNPLTLYAITKYEGEQMAMEREQAMALRFTTVFGISPRLRMDLLVNDLTFQAVRNKAVAIFQHGARRSFLHCNDAAESYLFALDHVAEMTGGVFNVGNPALNLSKHDVVEAIQAFTDFYLLEDTEREDPDQRDYEVDFTKIMSLGYCPKLTLEDGIRELLKLYSVSSFYRHFRNS